MNYIEASFEVIPVVPCRDILMAELAERGFESFVETETGLQAYITEDQFQEELLLNLCADAEKWSVSHKVIADENWNAEWEKNFSPIVIGEDIVIRAPRALKKSNLHKIVSKREEITPVISSFFLYLLSVLND
jgi:ribosomal protein L11 methyltransferase